MAFVIGGEERFHLTWDFDGRVGDGFCTMGYIIILDHFKTVIFDLQLYKEAIAVIVLRIG